jgi:hypothetical protein
VSTKTVVPDAVAATVVSTVESQLSVTVSEGDFRCENPNQTMAEPCCAFLEIRTGRVWWTTDHRLANTGSDQREESKLKVIKGGCLCGASRYVAHGEPINVRVCHCRVCQRALGAAFNARVLMPLNAVTMSGALGRRNSSPVLVRGFCTICGTSLFTERASAGVIGLTCGSLDMPEDCQPTEHIWTSSKQAWLTLNDGLPQYPEGAPA